MMQPVAVVLRPPAEVFFAAAAAPFWQLAIPGSDGWQLRILFHQQSSSRCSIYLARSFGWVVMRLPPPFLIVLFVYTARQMSIALLHRRIPKSLNGINATFGGGGAAFCAIWVVDGLTPQYSNTSALASCLSNYNGCVSNFVYNSAPSGTCASSVGGSMFDN
jgi:hypothetical protein